MSLSSLNAANILEDQPLGVGAGFVSPYLAVDHSGHFLCFKGNMCTYCMIDCSGTPGGQKKAGTGAPGAGVTGSPSVGAGNQTGHLEEQVLLTAETSFSLQVCF